MAMYNEGVYTVSAPLLLIKYLFDRGVAGNGAFLLTLLTECSSFH